MVQVFLKIADKNACLTWFVIELQGDLETKTEGISLSGKFVGDLHFTKKGVPVLIIGHHILYGKCADLEKPLAIIEKNPDCTESSDHVSMETESSTNVNYLVKALVKKKLIFKTRPKPIIANVSKKI